MKKNRMMRIASCLLVLVLLTTCVISGTFAKYVTSDNATDTVLVAKWGVSVNVEDNQTAVIDTSDDNTEGHIFTNSGNLTAPGTAGKLADITIGGTPQVAVTVSYKAVLVFDSWTWDDDADDTTPEVDYMPLVFIINGTEYTDSTMSGLKTKVETAISEYSKSYAAGTDLAAQTTDVLVVTWKWAFAGNDAADTYLANKGTMPQFTFNLTCTVTQID